MNTPREHNLQVRCVKYLRIKYPHLSTVFYAVPNGGLRAKTTAAMLKSEGATAGVADLCLDLPSRDFHGLRIEMKAGTTQSPAQKVFQRAMIAAGYRYVVCHSYEEFCHTVDHYIEQAQFSVIDALRTLYGEMKREDTEKARAQLQALIRKARARDEA